jgi:hypothetical protein
MKHGDAPVVATWLLDRLTSGPARDALAGDLIEQYRQGRSRAWYWWQVLVAIVVATIREVRLHWIIAIRALVIGWGVLIGLAAFIAPHVVAPAFRFLNNRGLMMSQWRVHYYWDLMWAIDCAEGLIAGWIVGRAHRRHQAPTVLVCAASVLLAALPGLFSDVVNVVQDPAAWNFALSVHVTTLLITGLSIVIGGLWSRRAIDTPAHLA